MMLYSLENVYRGSMGLKKTMRKGTLLYHNGGDYFDLYSAHKRGYKAYGLVLEHSLLEEIRMNHLEILLPVISEDGKMMVSKQRLIDIDRIISSMYEIDPMKKERWRRVAQKAARILLEQLPVVNSEEEVLYLLTEQIYLQMFAYLPFGSAYTISAEDGEPVLYQETLQKLGVEMFERMTPNFTVDIFTDDACYKKSMQRTLYETSPTRARRATTVFLKRW